jgi:spermidine synthase
VSVPIFLKTRLPEDFLADKDKLVDFIEGLDSNLAVVKQGETLTLEINRLWQGQDKKGHQIMAAHIPMMMHPDPENVLVIGAGVGQTASRFLFYDIRQLDYVEIEREIFGFVKKHFQSDWMSDKRLNLIVEDGRSYLHNTDRKYDIISIEVGQTFRPGIASFYTAEFYAQAEKHLNNKGLVCQFVPISVLRTDQFLSIIHTFVSVFPQSTLWYNRSEFLLIGSAGDDISIHAGRLDMLASKARIQEDLSFAYWGGPAHYLNQKEIFLGNFLIGPEKLLEISSNSPVYQDDLPVLEYSVGHDQPGSSKPIIDLIFPFLDSIDILDREKEYKTDYDRIRFTRDRNLRDIIANLLYHRAFANQAKAHNGLPYLENALQWNPENVTVLMRIATVLSRQGKSRDAIIYFQKALNILPENHQIHAGLGWEFLIQGEVDKAITHYLEAIRLRPEDYGNYRDISTAFLQKGDTKQAVAHLEKALALKPDSAGVYFNLGTAMYLQREFKQAINYYYTALELNPDYPETHFNLGLLMTEQGDLEKAISHYQLALKLRPDYVQAQVNLDSLLKQQKDEIKQPEDID